MFYQVILLDAVSDYDRPYIYKSELALEKGQLVLVPFGRGNTAREGVILGQGEPLAEAKSILKPTRIRLHATALKAMAYLSHYYAMPPAAYARLFLPKALRVEPKVQLIMRDDLSEAQITQYLKLQGDEEKLRNSGLCQEIFTYRDQVRLSEKEMLYTPLTFGQLEEILMKLPANYRRQKDILERLFHHYPQGVERKGESLNAIRALENKGFLKRILLPQRLASRYRELPGSYRELPQLSTSEERILRTLEGPGGLYLLQREGTSGMSLYLSLARKCLEEGKKFILLFPDASLIPAAVEIFKEHYGEEVGVYHGKMSLKEQKSELLSFMEGRFPIMITSRLGLFLPLAPGDTLVLEECQDDGYVSSHPYYHSHELAAFYAREQGYKVLFASSVPPLELTLREDLQRLYLKDASRQNPKVDLIDMRQELATGNRSPLSRFMVEEIRKLLQNGGLGFLLMNRRHYATYVFCRECGYALYCPQCHNSLHYDQRKKALFCPSCNLISPPVPSCPQCHSRAFRYYGGGIQMVYEELSQLFPQARIQVVDAQTMEEKEGYIELHKRLKEKKIDLLLGTSLIAKGLHDDVDLLGVINADFYLHTHSYRATEKGFQLLKLFLEKGHPGCRALVQTYDPKNYVLQGVLKGDVAAFLDKEAALRRSRNLPPFVSNLVVRISGDPKTMDDRAKEMMEELRGHGAEISEVYGHWLYKERRILIKAEDPEEIKEHLLRLHTERPWQFRVEVDPID